MPKNKRRWLSTGGAAIGLAMLAVLAWALVWLPRDSPGKVTREVTEVAWSAASPFADSGATHSGMTPHERLEPPVMSDTPTQIEGGHYGYWTSCMVCHGDRGQGLTEEWRTVLDPTNRNCWQSECHAANHPPEGFEIPRPLPVLMGLGSLTRYETAEDLFDYLRSTMPWPSPGLFRDEQYWELTAYLLDANGVDLGKPLVDHEKAATCDCEGSCECEQVKEPLGPDNAAEILVIPHLVQTRKTDFTAEQIAAVVVVGLFLCAAVLYWVLQAL